VQVYHHDLHRFAEVDTRMSQPTPLPFDPADAWRVPYTPTPWDLWTRTNVGEVFPNAVTPLSFTVMDRIAAGFVTDPRRLRLIPPHLIRDGRPPAVFRVINGRLYYNSGLMYYLFTEHLGLPSWFWLLSLGGPQDNADPRLRPRPLRPLRLLRGLPTILRESARQRRAVATFTRFRPRIQAEATALRGEDLGGLSTAELAARLVRICHAARDPLAWLFDGSAAALNAFGVLAGLCQQWCGSRALANELVSGLATLDTARATLALWEVARTAAQSERARSVIETAAPDTLLDRLHAEPEAAATLAALERFLKDFGHRGTDEFELAAPRWGEDLSFVLATLRAYLQAPATADPSAQLARQRRQRAAAERRARRQMQPHLLQRVVPYRWLVFRMALREARRLLPMRENPKHHFLRYVAELRRTVLVLAARLVASGLLADHDDIFYLTLDELIATAETAERGQGAPGVRHLVAARRALYARYRAWTPPDAVPGREIGRLEREVAAAVPSPLAPKQGGPDEGMLHGIAASGGVATGRARVAHTLEEGTAIQPGEVLVAPSTDPGWTPLFAVAAAVVTDLGGVLSHGAIVAREYGIPAVVNTRHATVRIRTGQTVTVDGTAGTVRIAD
jgi:phosphohistidine swiveling domain-containing protein